MLGCTVQYGDQVNLQPAAAGEPRLLAGSPQFVRVAAVRRWTVYRVTEPRPLVEAVAAPAGAPAAGSSVVSYGALAERP